MFLIIDPTVVIPSMHWITTVKPTIIWHLMTRIVLNNMNLVGHFDPKINWDPNENKPKFFSISISVLKNFLYSFKN